MDDLKMAIEQLMGLNMDATGLVNSIVETFPEYDFAYLLDLYNSITAELEGLKSATGEESGSVQTEGVQETIGE
jgi:hypothetical protein